MKTKDLLDEIKDLPVDMRAQLADEILQTLNPIEPHIQTAWIEEVQKREKDVEAGRARMIPGDHVFRKADEIIGK